MHVYLFTDSSLFGFMCHSVHFDPVLASVGWLIFLAHHLTRHTRRAGGANLDESPKRLLPLVTLLASTIQIRFMLISVFRA